MRFLILPIIFGDWVLFKLVSALFSLIMEIVDAKIFTSLNIDELITKVYIIVGVLMLFKLVISAIQYLINPDTFDDKEKGLFGILQRMAISVALLALFPVVFDYAMKMQSVVVAQLPKLILGAQYDTYDKSKIGEEVSFTIVSNFIYPATDVLPGGAIIKGASNVIEAIMTSGLSLGINAANSVGTNGITVGENGTIHDLNSFLVHATDGCSFVLPLPSCDYFYIPVLPLLVGAYMCFVLLSAAIDVVVRLIKLNIIRILAPIPITGYVFNKEKLTKFLKTFLQVYADLFIRLAAIYFTLFLMKFVVGELKAGIAVTNTTDWVLSAAVKVMVIVGILVFAKKAPKFITDLLGLEGVGESIGDMFKRAGGLFGGTAAAVTAGVGNFQNSMKNFKNAKKNWDASTSFGQKLKDSLRVPGSTIGGASSAMFRGTRAALNGKGLKEAFNTGHKGAVTARQNRELDNLNKVRFRDRATARYQDFMGLDTQESLAEAKQKAYSTLHSDVGAYKKAVMGRIDKNPTIAMRTDVKAGSAIDQLGQLLASNATIINNGSNADLKNILSKFKLETYVDKNGTHQAYTLKKGEHIGYYDLEAVRVNAEQEHIGSISSKMEPLKTIAQKELFSDAMYGRVMDVSGNLIDEINYGDAEYRKRGITKERSAHSDITTAVQNAQQHIAENAVPLNGGNSTELQQWFEGTLPVDSPHYGEDFGGLDDHYQRESEKLSAQMATSKAHLARESNQRRKSNQQQNSGK